jgi:hypothetical protein
MHHDLQLVKRLQGILTAYSLDADTGRLLARELVDEGQLWPLFLLINGWFERFGSEGDFGSLVDGVEKHGRSLAELVRSAYADAERQRRFMLRRGMLRQVHQRLFLALLANLLDRDAIDDVLGQLFPSEDPAALLLSWVKELASPQYQGISGLSLDSEVLASPDLDGAHLLALVGRQWRTPQLLRGTVY